MAKDTSNDTPPVAGSPAAAVSQDTASQASQLAADAAALASSVSAQGSVEAPSIAEQAKTGSLPDPVELALKARGLSGSGRRLDETIPGGLTVHPEGYFQNAEGKEVDAEGNEVVGGKQPRIDLTGARIQAL